MTCIAAVRASGRVTMGGDSAASGGWSIAVRTDPKVFRVGPLLLGTCGSIRASSLLRYGFTPPDHDPRISDHEYLATKFVEAVRTAFKNGGHGQTKEGEDVFGGNFLIGYRGGLYVVDADYQVGTPSDDFAACGSGEDLALGALYATKGKPPKQRVRIALEAAERFSVGVRGPFTILS